MGFIDKITGKDAKKKAKKAAEAAAREAARQAAIARSRANIAAIKSKREELRDQRAQDLAGGEVGQVTGSFIIDTTDPFSTFNQQGGGLTYLQEEEQAISGDRLVAFGQSAKSPI